MNNAENQIPPQQSGGHTDFTEERSFAASAEAHRLFLQATGKLLDVNNWHQYAGAGSAKFTLTNNLGEKVAGRAREGFCINIDLPAPGSSAGDGLEWVMIEKIETAGSAKASEEFIALTARPIPDPRKSETQVAHFFDDRSTSTFIIRRQGTLLAAGVHGRNESPNNQDVGLHDKVRNTLVAFGARWGLSGPQWKKLVKGLLSVH